MMSPGYSVALFRPGQVPTPTPKALTSRRTDLRNQRISSTPGSGKYRVQSENSMKKLAALFAVSTFLALGASAKAADLVEAPAVYDWTGFYVGGNLGYAFGGNDKVGLRSTTEVDLKDIDKLELHDIFGGGQIGHDWQASS